MNAVRTGTELPHLWPIKIWRRSVQTFIWERDASHVACLPTLFPSIYCPSMSRHLCFTHLHHLQTKAPSWASGSPYSLFASGLEQAPWFYEKGGISWYWSDLHCGASIFLEFALVLNIQTFDCGCNVLNVLKRKVEKVQAWPTLHQHTTGKELQDLIERWNHKVSDTSTFYLRLFISRPCSIPLPFSPLRIHMNCTTHQWPHICLQWALARKQKTALLLCGHRNGCRSDHPPWYSSTQYVRYNDDQTCLMGYCSWHMHDITSYMCETSLQTVFGRPNVSDGAASFPGTKWIWGNPSLFAGIAMIFLVTPVIRRNRIFIPRKGVCGRARVGKWVLVMTLCLYARWMQMAESRRGCTPAQQSMCSSNPLAFTSRFSAVAAELLISRHALCHKTPFLWTKILFRVKFFLLVQRQYKSFPPDRFFKWNWKNQQIE